MKTTLADLRDDLTVFQIFSDDATVQRDYEEITKIFDFPKLLHPNCVEDANYKT
jgi:hypothetical protein